MAADESTINKLLRSTGLTQFFGAAKSAPAMRDALAGAMPLIELPGPSVEAVHDIHLAGGAGPLSAKVYIPHGASETGAGLVFFHGGGFMVGSAADYDPFCRRLAAQSGVRIVSVDYRLAPENRFPAAVDDALAAFDTIRAGRLSAYGFSPDRLAVGGDSAGGTLAAVIAQSRRGQPVFQLLIYPLLQLVEIRKQKARWQDGPFLSTEALAQIREAYLKSPEQASDVRVSPLLEQDLKGVAPAYILAAELDPLLAEGAAYADRLAAFGIPVERVVYDGVPHGFLNMTRIVSVATPAIGALAKALARGLKA